MSRKRRVLVTGADGFIGSHLAEALVRSGHDVRALVYYNAFNARGWLDHIDAETRDAMEIVAGDVRDTYGVRRAIEGCDTVLHLAALIGIPYSYHAPEAYVDTNITGTLNVLQAARDLDIDRVVHTSTSEVYGTAQFVPITEAHPLQAQSPYAASKIAADQLALSFHRSFETPVTVLRPFNTYGPRQSVRAVIPTIVTQILAGRRKISLGALTPTRDFNFVGDIVRAFVAAMEADGAVGEVVNAGSGFEISVGDTAALIAELMGADIVIESDQQRIRPEGSEVDRLWADASRAADLLGWTPDYGGLDGFRRGLGEAIAWYSNPANAARFNARDYAI